LKEGKVFISGKVQHSHRATLWSKYNLKLLLLQLVREHGKICWTRITCWYVTELHLRNLDLSYLGRHSISVIFSFFDVLPKFSWVKFSLWKSATSSELLGSLQLLLSYLEVCNVLWLLKGLARLLSLVEIWTSSELLGSMQHLLERLLSFLVIWTSSELLGSLQCFWVTWKSSTSSELPGSLQCLLSYLEVCNASELLGSLQHLLSYLEVCNGFWATEVCNVFWSTCKSAKSSELLGSLQRLLSYLEVCNIFWATWMSTTSSELYLELEVCNGLWTT